MTALIELGAAVGWPDGEAATAARAAIDARTGRLAELVEWYAAARGGFPPGMPHRVRCLTLGPASGPVAELAAALDVGVREVESPADPADAFGAGRAVADDEIEAGADLIVLAGRDDTLAPAVLIGLLTGAEPVALLPRGADAVDSQRWIAQAGQLRDTRRRVAPLRTRPDELLAALSSPVVGVAAGIALRAAARRTPVVLDGTAVLAAALLCVDSQSKARRWWQVADVSPDRSHARAVEQLALRPLLDLGTRLGDGTAGLLAVAVLRAAVLRAAVLTGPRDE
jgi:nicotinate-nucleotide--dimethylbenzimidazole phosphoribosyltransferase